MAPVRVVNALGQPLDTPVADWAPRPRPAGDLVLEGRHCRLVPLAAEAHAADLWQAHALDSEHRAWTYLGNGPYDRAEDFTAWLAAMQGRPDPLFLTVIDRPTGRAVGTIAYLRIDPDHGVIEIGYVHFSPLLQRRPAATEAVALLLGHAFDGLGYRRVEWKCNALNTASRAAAERLGFTFEGVFRQARVEKGRNRDTAWYSLLDREWPARRAAFAAWLAPENFDAEGRQRQRLAELARTTETGAGEGAGAETEAPAAG